MLCENKESTLRFLLERAGVPTKHVVATFTSGSDIRLSFIARKAVYKRSIRTQTFQWEMVLSVLYQVPQGFGLERTWNALEHAWLNDS